MEGDFTSSRRFLQKMRVNERNSDVSTSLTTSDVSRNLCFLIFLFGAQLSCQRGRTGSFRESNNPASSMIYIQPHGSARFFIIIVVAQPTRHLFGHLRS
jgi:hypothetical protein